MQNVQITVEGDTLTIKADLTKDFGPSSSGKTTIVATTSGNQTVEHKGKTFKVGLNIYKPRS